MANPYARLFAVRGTFGFSWAAFVGRLPLPMTGIGIITMLAQLRGSYALAGAVSATFVLTYAVLAPQISRYVDRYGQGKILVIAAAISAIGLGLLVASTYFSGPDWLLFMFAMLGGFMPSMSAMARARWTAIYRGKPELQTAYSLETVLDEVSFIAGPPISVGLAVAVFPQAGLLASIVALIIGVLSFVVQRSTEPPIEEKVSVLKEMAVIKDGGIVVLTLLLVAMGIVVGTVDIGSVAFSEAQGVPFAASVVLSAYAVGSCLAGLAFGVIKLSIPLPKLLLLGGIATALTTLPLMIVGSIPALVGAVFVAGVCFAPTMIIAMTLVEQLVPEAKLTEGLTWLLAGLNTGVAIGAAVAGQIVDRFGVQSGFGVASSAGLFIVVIAAIGHQLLKSRISG